MQPGIPRPALTKSLKGHLTWKFNQTTSTVIPPQPLHFRKASSVSDILIFIADGSKKKKKKEKTSWAHKPMLFSWGFYCSDLTQHPANKQTKKRLFSVTHYYSRISVNIWYWSRRSRNPAGWPCRRHTKSLLPRLDREPRRAGTGRGRDALLTGSWCKRGQRPGGWLCGSTAGESSWEGRGGAGEGCSAAPPPGPGLAAYSLGADP